MQDRGENFERAQSLQDLGVLGDPERWGGRVEVQAFVPNGRPSDQVIFSNQVVRAQCADMIARAWELTATYRLDEELPVTDVGSLELEITFGTGQASGVARLQLAGGATIAPAIVPWITDTVSGTVQTPAAIPAVAIAARVILRIAGDGTEPDHTVRVRVSVFLAPRALV